MKKQQYWYFLVDADRKTFSINGPVMFGSLVWDEQVEKELAAGRNLTRSVQRPEQQMKNVRQQLLTEEYHQVLMSEILSGTPIDRTADFSGRLPQYARSADRSRIVKLLCAHCKVGRLAEMDRPYPGQEALQSANENYHARCLSCGTIARDAYNWGR